MRTSNPSFSKKIFSSIEHVSGSEQMTVKGTIDKTALSLLLVFVSAGFVWSQFMSNGFTTGMMGILIASSILAFVVALITIFKRTWAPVTTPIYALLEGGLLGLLSAFLETLYPGIVMQAVALTFGVLLVMLAVYRYEIIKVTNKLRMGIVIATGSIVLVYVVSWIISLFGVPIPLFGSGPIGILFSLVVVGIAAFNLLLDFDFIQEGAKRNLPKYMEWYGAFGLLVTLIWLYIEILRLLSKLRGRD